MVVSLRRAKVKGIARDFTPAQVQLVRVNLDAPRLPDVFTDARNISGLMIRSLDGRKGRECFFFTITNS